MRYCGKPSKLLVLLLLLLTGSYSWVYGYSYRVPLMHLSEKMIYCFNCTELIFSGNSSPLCPADIIGTESSIPEQNKIATVQEVCIAFESGEKTFHYFGSTQSTYLTAPVSASLDYSFSWCVPYSRCSGVKAEVNDVTAFPTPEDLGIGPEGKEVVFTLTGVDTLTNFTDEYTVLLSFRYPETGFLAYLPFSNGSWYFGIAFRRINTTYISIAKLAYSVPVSLVLEEDVAKDITGDNYSVFILHINSTGISYSDAFSHATGSFNFKEDLITPKIAITGVGGILDHIILINGTVPKTTPAGPAERFEGPPLRFIGVVRSFRYLLRAGKTYRYFSTLLTFKTKEIKLFNTTLLFPTTLKVSKLLYSDKTTYHAEYLDKNCKIWLRIDEYPEFAKITAVANTTNCWFNLTIANGTPFYKFLGHAWKRNSTDYYPIYLINSSAGLALSGNFIPIPESQDLVIKIPLTPWGSRLYLKPINSTKKIPIFIHIMAENLTFIQFPTEITGIILNSSGYAKELVKQSSLVLHSKYLRGFIVEEPISPYFGWLTVLKEVITSIYFYPYDICSSEYAIDSGYRTLYFPTPGRYDVICATRELEVGR